MEYSCEYWSNFNYSNKCDFMDDENCILNLVIFENNEKTLFYNLPEKRIFKIQRGKGLSELDFKEAIREIDIIPTKNADWKRAQILKLAKDLGFFGLS